jgi:hypothetical protein
MTLPPPRADLPWPWHRRGVRWIKKLGVPLGLRLGTYAQYPPRELDLGPGAPSLPLPNPAPTISIVTPSLNQGRFLAATLDSVLEQGYPALEYFVQDGGSSDRSVEVLRRYHSRLTGWVSGPDGGQADAINRGFAHTHGAIMAWLNADDLLLPGTLAYVAGYLHAHPEVDAVYGHRIVIDEQGREVGRWVLPRHTRGMVVWRDYIPQETLFWRRTLWDKAGGHLDASLHVGMDWELAARFESLGACLVRLPRFLGAFRTHAGQKSLAQHEQMMQGEGPAIRRKYAPTTGRALWCQAVSAAYLARSMGCWWAYRVAARNQPRP